LSKGVNSSAPTTGEIVAGVYNATPPTLQDGQAAALQLDVNGKLITSGSSGGTSNVNIADVNGAPPALTNPLPVELSDGTNSVGTAGNPLSVNVISGGGSNASVGATGAAAPTSATEIGIIVGANLQGVSASNPIPVTGTLTAVTSITNQVDTNLKQVGGANTSTAASGVQKVGIVGNAGAILDGATAASVPANAILQGLRAATTYPTAVTDGQMVGAMADKAGRQATVLNAPRDLIGTSIVSNSSATSAASLIGAGASGVFNDIITLIITNRSSTATVVSLTDGTTTYTFAIAANGGIVCNFPTPLPATSSATAWTIGNSAAVACDYMTVYAKNK
jgi:hypothetical protein